MSNSRRSLTIVFDTEDEKKFWNQIGIDQGCKNGAEYARRALIGYFNRTAPQRLKDVRQKLIDGTYFKTDKED